MDVDDALELLFAQSIDLATPQSDSENENQDENVPPYEEEPVFRESLVSFWSFCLIEAERIDNDE